MAEPRDVGEKSGLDYLITSGKIGPVTEQGPKGDEASPPPLSDRTRALEALAARAVLQSVESLEQAKGEVKQGVRLSEIAEEIKLSADILLPLVRELEGLGLLATLDSSAFGDNLVTLTEKATDLLKDRNVLELLQSLGMK